MSLNSPSSSNETEMMQSSDAMGPPSKKIKLIQPRIEMDKLENRLGDILCCVVCLDLTNSLIYQCSNGHLMCAGCFTHLLADARLRDEDAKCPTCRVDLSKQLAQRNLAVEKALSELPAKCRFCEKGFPRNVLSLHEESDCEERLTLCKYSMIGCPWRGPKHEQQDHESKCSHPHKSGSDIMEALIVLNQKAEEERNLYSSIFDLMSFEKILFNDLQLKPYRTDEYVHKLFYETSRFSAFFTQWVVKARVNHAQSDPSHSCERSLTYQLCLKSNNKLTNPIMVHYLVVHGPYGDMKVQPKLYKFEFTEEDSNSPFHELPLKDTSECNRLLAAKVINFRLIMFILSR